MKGKAAEFVLVVCAIGWLAWSGHGCNRDAKSALKGQSNTTVTFYGKAVDQDGVALGGVRFEYRREAYPKDWTFDTRGRPNEASTITTLSDNDGRFQFSITGCKLILMNAEVTGFRHLRDDDHHTDAINNWFFCLIAWGDPWYRTNADHPAIYVFVRDGVHQVAALPCRGGSDSGGGPNWVANRPEWPHKPSLDDVVQEQTATKP